MPIASRGSWIALLRRLQIWTGLFAFTSLLVFAVAGLNVTFRPPDADDRGPVREVPFQVPADLTDKELADRVHAELRLPLTNPIAPWAVRRSRDHRLVLNFYTPNGTHRVTVLEEASLLEVETRRNSLGQFLNLMHARFLYGSQPDLRLRLWAAYVDLSLFALLFLTVSGIWLWLEARPRLRWAQLSLGLGIGLFAAVWWSLR